MVEKDELDRIEEDFDFDTTEEDVASDVGKDDISETQSERLERLHQEGELTDDEFNLIHRELIERSGSKSESPENSGSQNRNPVDWLPEETVTEIIELFREAIGDQDPYSDSPEIDRLDFQIASLPPDAKVSMLFHVMPPTAVIEFTEREQEERLRECVTKNPPYEIDIDFTKDGSTGSAISVAFNVIPSGYDGELSDEDIITEINHLFQTISNTYGVTISDLSAGTITVEAG